jgi:hypothetical protein
VIRLFALCSGYIELDRASMLDDLPAGQPWTVPVLSFLVAHPRGRLLFDTGIHERAPIDPIGRLGAERAKRLIVFESDHGESIMGVPCSSTTLRSGGFCSGQSAEPLLSWLGLAAPPPSA